MSEARTYEVELVDLPEQPTVIVRGRAEVSAIGAFLGAAFGEIAAVLQGQQSGAISGPPFARYGMRAEGGWEVEAGFPCTGSPRVGGRVELSSLPAGRVAHTRHVGAYDTLPAAYEAVQAWLSEHGYHPAGPQWECYLDEPQVPAPRTDVYVPCAADEN